MKKKQQALFHSAIALLLCVSMFVGTTFAWFTDQVSSLNNIITAGNLDVELEFLDKNGNWKTVQDSSEVFDKNTLWEPGHTEVAYLRVSNLGTLALKYQLGVNIASETASVNVYGNPFKLSEYIFFDAIDDVKTAYASRDEARAAVDSITSIARGYTKPGTIEANGEPHYVAIVVYMPEEVGNEANHAKNVLPPQITLGINVVATQAPSENDSFDNSYDNNAKFPELDLTPGITVNVTPDANNKVASDLTIGSNETSMSATVPAGVQLQAGTTSMKLSVSEMKNSNANISLETNEITRSLDVHISGVAANNAVPMLVTIKKAMMPGLNMGNYKLYHVENGATVAMTYVASAAELDAHNEFTYDPVTGDITMALASFSEVAMVAEPAKWEGKFDYTWYDADATELQIANADQLAGFGAIVGGMNGQTQDSFSGKTVKLVSDINLGDDEENNVANKIFYPIGYWNNEGTYERKPLEERTTAVESGFYAFKGTFDGNGHTIANFYQNTWEMKGDHNWYDPIKEQYYRDGMGLFGKVYGGTVKNLTVSHFSSDGEIATTGVIAAYADGATFENIAITKCNPRVYNIGNGGIVGCVGWYAKDADLKTTFKNITVDNTNKISALWGSYDVACGGIVGQYYPTSGQTSAGSPENAGIHFENCHVSAQMDVYNDVCANYQYYAYRYTGMLIGSVRENETIDGHVYPKMDGITAKDCTVHFGTWNDYYYCEIIDNTTASYTHDYQMSRLTEIKAIDGTTITYLDGTTGTVPASGRANYVIVDYTKGHGTENATCYHFKDGAVWTHDMGGIQTGIDENGDGQDDLKEDKQHIYLEFNNLVTGYGWGVTSRGFSNLNGVTNLDITQGNQEASVEKFEDAGYTPKDYKVGETIRIGDLFKAKNGVTINTNSVYVSVSPVIEGDKVSATFALDEDNWENSTITFAEDSKGTAKISITDYIFCTPTVIYLNEEAAVEKFTVNNVSAQNAYTQITLGKLFGAKDGVTIGNVTATITDPNGTETTVTGTSSNWITKTIDLIKEGTWTVSIVDDDKYCAATETTFTVNKVDKFTKKFTQNFLYRVGNQNTVAVGSIFGEIETAVKLSSVNVTIANVAGNASGAYTSNATWTNGKIQFSGTGVVKVTISADGANPVEINLEVVDAYNVTNYSELKERNSVLLSDITMSSGGTYRLTGNKVLYGNGFTFNVRNGAYVGVDYDYQSYVIYLENSRLDNVKIEGAVYPNIGGTKADDYNRAIVMTNGDSKITNSYISNGASPIRNGGNLELINTTLKGGIYANLDLRNGHLILDNVTTINQIGSNEKYINTDGSESEIVGMGIVVYQEGGTEELKITIRNVLTQYNYLSKTQADTYFKDTYRKAVKDIVFGDDFTNYQNNGIVNFGIISMNNYFTKVDLIDERTDKAGYLGKEKKISLLGNERDCYVYTFKPSSSDIPTCSDYESAGQGVIKPSVKFDFENKNYVAKTDGSNDYCYADGNTVYISMDEGDVFNWNTAILTAIKNGTLLDYTVKVENVDYTAKSIEFSTSGSYEVVYTYTDGNNYKLENNQLATFSQTYTVTINIEVAVVEAAAKHAEFSFGANGTAYSGKIVTIGDKTYVMPDVNATVSGKIGSKTVNGVTVYYPIAEMYTSDGVTAHKGSWYACFPIFKDALQIIDYADKGTGDAVTYNQKTVTEVNQIPSTLKAVDPKTAFLYSMNATNYPPPTDPTAVSGAVCYTCNRNGLTASNERKEENTVAEYTYTDNAGTVYYYYVGYHCAKQTNGCVTPDTLVTLADGTQVRVDSLTGNEELLVWNMETGMLDKAPIMFVDSDPETTYEVIKLIFSDGTEVKVIYEHGFWDYDLNKYVYLDKDAEKYIGHTFAKQNGDSLEKVQLVDVVIENEVTTAWSPVTEGHLCYFVNGMLSMPGGVGGLFNIFEVDAETMTYDFEAMQKDIETYGLYTYEELNAIAPLSEEMFNAAGGAYLKVSIGKGNLTEEELIRMINRYSKFFN